MLSIVHNNGHSVAHYLHRLHNLACDLGWLAWPILAKGVWPKIRSKRRRAVTAEEHAKIIASKKNPEKRAYYEFLYETGVYSCAGLRRTPRQLGLDSEPARLIAFVIVPPLDEYESIAQRKVIAMPLRLTLKEQNRPHPEKPGLRIAIPLSSIFGALFAESHK